MSERWETTIIGNYVYIVEGHKEIAIVCVKPDAGHLYKPAKMEAHANLLASAPDLLAACEAMALAYVRNEPRGGIVFKQAQMDTIAAIAKTKGE